MVERLFARVTAPVRGLHEAAYVLAGLTLASQALALVRDRLLAGTFGASSTLDLYYAAFRIPDLLFATVASLLSLYALMPVLSRLEEEHPGKMLTFLRQMLGAFFVAMGVIALGVWIFAPYLIGLIAPGFAGDPARAADLILLTRILLLQPIFLGASNLLANLTQLRHRFTLYAISPLLYNIGIIVGIVFFYPRIGVEGLAWGVVLGAVLHFLTQIPFFMSERERGSVPFRESLAYVKSVLALSIPRTLALASTQISLLALTALASYFAAGSISVFTFAFNLQAVPIAIIGVSYSVAAFPTLARLHVAGARAELAEHVTSALRHLLFWSIPATVLIVVLRAQIVRVILGAGAFDWSATRLTAAALALFILSLAAQNAILLISRAYYAAGNSRKPLLFGLVDVVVSIGGGFVLASFFHGSPALRSIVESLLRVDNVAGSTVLMLALAFALGSIAEALVGYSYFVRDFGLIRGRIRRLMFQSFGASIVGGAASYTILNVLHGSEAPTTTLVVFLSGLIAGLVGVGVIVLVLVLLKNPEITEIYHAIRSRVVGSRVVLEPTDIEGAV